LGVQALASNESRRMLSSLVHLRHHQTFMAPGFIPQSELYAVPEPQFVVDGAEIVFDDVFSGSDFVGDFLVFKSSCDEFDDSLLALVWC